VSCRPRRKLNRFLCSLLVKPCDDFNPSTKLPPPPPRQVQVRGDDGGTAVRAATVETGPHHSHPPAISRPSLLRFQLCIVRSDCETHDQVRAATPQHSTSTLLQRPPGLSSVRERRSCLLLLTTPARVSSRHLSRHHADHQVRRGWRRCRRQDVSAHLVHNE